MRRHGLWLVILLLAALALITLEWLGSEREMTVMETAVDNPPDSGVGS